ncbi:unnamed protein product [Brassica rapa subsp. trilocularis]|uniref:(rape) hypothetical protein n=1 Tax=Brassica napus TaxID=3708 RepID=A0A816YSB1_BRANA|nr:unnamed protein product [Brassica napus]
MVTFSNNLEVLRKRNIYRRPDKSSNITNQCKILEYERTFSFILTPRHVQLKDRSPPPPALSFPTALISLSVRGCGLSIR